MHPTNVRNALAASLVVLLIAAAPQAAAGVAESPEGSPCAELGSATRDTNESTVPGAEAEGKPSSTSLREMLASPKPSVSADDEPTVAPAPKTGRRHHKAWIIAGVVLGSAAVVALAGGGGDGAY